MFTVYDALSGQQTEYSLEQLEAFVLALEEQAVAMIFVWQESWTDWRPLTEIPELMILRPNLETTVGISRLPSQPSTEGAEAEVIEKRRSERLAGRLRVIVVLHELIFRTFSIDISVHGLRLEQPVPERMMGEILDCYISRPDLKSALKFKAKLILGQDQFVRFEFLEPKSQTQKTFKQWLKKAGSP